MSRSAPGISLESIPDEMSAQSCWWPRSVPFYYGWINVVMASVSMTATLPSRTHGMGLISSHLMSDLRISETLFAEINAISTVIGAAFCLPVGFLIDRYGVRVVLTVVSILFGAVVLGMATVTGPVSLLIALILIRGFGQSALSIVSTAIVGKWFGRRMGLAMGVYAVLLSFGFIGGIVGVEEVARAHGWRTAWNGLGWFLLVGLAPLAWLFVRSSPSACGLVGDDAYSQQKDSDEMKAHPTAAAQLTRDYTYQQALSTPMFWVIAIGTSMFNFVWSAITLLNQSVLMEQGFSDADTRYSLALLVPGGLLANGICGALTRRHNVAKVLGLGMILLSISLALFPQISTPSQLRTYMLVMGVIGGIVTVAHFAAWRALYGASHLGRVQGPAQLISVLFSASGPWFAAKCHELTGSYHICFYTMSATVGLLAVAAFLVPTPPEQRVDS